MAVNTPLQGTAADIIKVAMIRIQNRIEELGLSARRSAASASALGVGHATAVLIASYSIVDKVGVSRSHPLAYIIVLFGYTGAILTPYVVQQRGDLFLKRPSQPAHQQHDAQRVLQASGRTRNPNQAGDAGMQEGGVADNSDYRAFTPAFSMPSAWPMPAPMQAVVSRILSGGKAPSV
jgi:hypothetical protein